VKKGRQRLRSFHPKLKSMVFLDQLNEVCLAFDETALRKLGDNVEAAMNIEDTAGAAGLIIEAIRSLGLTPIVPKEEDDTQSTASGPESSEGGSPPAAEARQPDPERERKRAEAEAKRAQVEKELAEERARQYAEKAEQRRLKEEAKRKEVAQAEAKKRQLEKKEEEKARKAEEKRQKEKEQEAQKKEKQKEEARQRAVEQAERDRKAAAALREEQDLERTTQLYEQDRLEKLGKFEPLSEQDLASELDGAISANPSLGAALRLAHQQAVDAGEGTEVATDRAMAILYKVGPVWALGLGAPAALKLPNAVRNRVKKARGRLRDTVSSCMARHADMCDGEEDLSEWQRGIAHGSLELPVWTLEAREDEERAAKEAQQQQPAGAVAGDAPPASGGKKGKKAKEQPKRGEEDLDELLAEFGVTPTAPKKGGKKKK